MLVALFEPLTKMRKVVKEDDVTPGTSDEPAPVEKKGKNKGKNPFPSSPSLRTLH